MPNFLVTWKIDVEADSPEEAAKEAVDIQRNHGSTATIFEVESKNYARTIVDLTMNVRRCAKCYNIIGLCNNFRSNNRIVCPTCYRSEQHD